MSGFGSGPFGSQPFGQWPWSKQVLWDLLPGLYQQQDALNGNVLQTWSESLRYSFDLMTDLIANWIKLRDPLTVRTAYDDVIAVVLGRNVTPPAPIEQRSVDGSISILKRFNAPSGRFKQADVGKQITLSNSSVPINNRTFVVASIINPTTILCDPPLVVDPGPIRWQLQGRSSLPLNVIAVEVHQGDVSTVVPGWVLFDGFSQFEVYGRAQFFPLSGQTAALTVRDGLKGLVLTDGSFKCEASFAQTNVGQPFSVSGSTAAVANSDFTNNAKYQIYAVSLTDPTVLVFHAPLTIQYTSPSGVIDPYGAVVYTLQNGQTGVQVAHLNYGPSITLFIIVDSGLINVYLGTDVGGNVTSTAADVVAAVNGFPAAAALVTASLSSAVTSLPSGPSAAVTSVSGAQATVTGLSGMTPSMVGLSLVTSGASFPINNGTFPIVSFLSNTSVVIENPGAIAGDLNNGSIVWSVAIGAPHLAVVSKAQTIPGTRLLPDPGPLTWSLLPVPQLQLVASTSPAGITTQQGIDLVLSGSTATAVTAKWSAVDVGNLIVVLGSRHGGNQTYKITKFINVTEVEVFPAVTLSGETAAVTAYGFPLATITGLSGMTPDLVSSYFAFSGAASSGNNGVFQIIAYISPNSVQVENLTGVAGDANNGSIAWSLYESGLTWMEHEFSSIVDGTEVSLNAPSLIDFLAQDFGITVDQRESETRQRGWVANLTQWTGFKGTAKGYEIIGSISGFDVIATALFRVSQPISLTLPDTSLYIVDEVGPGLQGPDGYLIFSFGAVVFTALSATFVPSDVGLLLQLSNCAVPGNNGLYTIDEYLSPTSVRFAPFNSAITPDYGLAGTATPLDPLIRWDICRLYTTQVPSRPHFDDVNGELMQSFVGASHFLPDTYCWQDVFVNHFPVVITEVTPGVSSSTGVPIYYEVTAQGQLVYVPFTPSGFAAAVSSTLGLTATITGLSDMTPALVGSNISFSGAASGGNNGIFGILQYLSPTSVVISNPVAVAPDANNGALAWFVPAGSAAQVTSTSGPLATISGLSGMTPEMIGSSLILQGANSPGNNGTFPIVTYLSSSQVVINNPGAVAPDAFNGFISWVVQTYTNLAVVQQAGPWQVVDNTAQLFFIEPPATPFQSQQIGLLLFTALAAGATGINVTINPDVSLSVVVIGGRSIVITIAPFTTTAEVAALLQSTPAVVALVSVAVIGDGTDVVFPTFARTFLQGGIVPVIQVSFGPPALYKFRVYSTEVPQTGLATVTYNCPVETTCNYCQASSVLLTITEGSIAGENGLAIEQVFDRVIARLEEEVKPAHVRLVPVLTRTLQASLNLRAQIDAGFEIYGVLLAPEQAYFDMLPSDLPFAPDPTLNLGGGAAIVFSVAGPTATIHGLAGMVPGLVGSAIYFAGAVVPGNNGRFLITAYHSATSVDIRNPSANAADANNGAIEWLLENSGLRAQIVTP